MLNIFNRLCAEGGLFLVWFSQDTCQVCKSIFPVFKVKMMEKYPKINLLKVDLQEYSEFSTRYSIYNVPTVIIFWDGREQFRQSRFIRQEKIFEKLDIIKGMLNS